MKDKAEVNLEIPALFKKHDVDDFKKISPDDIIVAQWVRMKCEFGCKDYGNASCPPNLPSVESCQAFFQEYDDVWILRFNIQESNQEALSKWNSRIKSRLLALERDVFLLGYPKVFLLSIGNCTLCSNCVAERKDCVHKSDARPTPEGMAVDLFSTVTKVGYPLKVLESRYEEINRYAILLVQ